MSATRTRILLGASAAALAALVLSSGFAEAGREDHPELAARFAPWHSAALSDQAIALVTAGNAANDAHVILLVQRALARDATSPATLELKALSFESAGNRAGAEKLYRLSDRISRRSLATRLWLVQRAVDAGDVEATLRHMDIALRTSSAAPDIIFPALARGIEDQSLIAPIAKLTDRPSDWRVAFYNQLVEQADGPAAARFLIAKHDRADIISGDLDRALAVRLIEDGQFGPAFDLAKAYQRLPTPLDWPIDGKFTDPSRQFPFGWQLATASQANASRSDGQDAVGLSYRVAPGQGGQLAVQMLMLTEGRYVIASDVAQQEPRGIGPSWSLSCASDGRIIAQLSDPTGSLTFAVPADCGAQWLALNAQPRLGAQAGTLRSVHISRAN